VLSLSRKWECVVVVVVVVVYFRSAREVLLVVRLTLAVSCVYRREIVVVCGRSFVGEKLTPTYPPAPAPN
jgi:hypothetical protein